MQAIKGFASTGDELDKMAKRTGIAVEVLSAMSFAAGRSGSSLKVFESAISRMQRGIVDAGNNIGTAKDAFEQLGVTIDDLEGKSPDEQFMILAEAISQVDDPTTRAGLALQLFGRNGAQLLPMMMEGADGIMKLREEAEQLGLVLSTEDADAAAILTDRMSEMFAAFKMVSTHIGAALAPAATMIATRLAAIGAAANKWIKANKPLVRTIAAVGLGLMAAGAVLLTFGGLVSLLGFAIGGIVTIFGAMASTVAAAGAVLGVIGGIIAAIVSPIGLAIGAVLAIGVAFITMTKTGRNAFSALTGAAGEAFKWLRGIFGEIASQLASGDIAGAAATAGGAITTAFGVARDGLASLWQSITKRARLAWQTIKETFNGPAILATLAGWRDMAAQTFTDMMEAGRRGFAKIAGFAADLAADFASPFELVRTAIVEGLTSAVTTAQDTGLAILKAIGGPFDGIGNLAKKVKKLWTDNLSSIGPAAGNAWQTLKDAGGQALESLRAIAGQAFGAISTAAGKMATVAGSVFSYLGGFVSSIFGSIANTAGTVIGFIGGAFAKLKEIFLSTFGGISDALTAGDLALAAEIAATGLKLAFLTAFTNINKAWLEFKTGLSGGFDAVISGIRKVWDDLSGAIAAGMLRALGFVAKLAAAIDSIDPMGRDLVGLLGLSDFDAEGTIKIMQEDRDRFKSGVDDRRQARDDARGQALTDDLAASEEALDALKARRDALNATAEDKAEASGASGPLEGLMDALRDSLSGLTDMLPSLPAMPDLAAMLEGFGDIGASAEATRDRKSTRLNSSH
jgi:hypothetical protein